MNRPEAPRASTIPVIDLAASLSTDPSERGRVASGVSAAAISGGIFYVTHHGIPAAVVDAQFELAREFFACDISEKAAIDVARSNCFRGYEAFASQTINAATPGDLKEGFIMGPELDAAHPHVLAGFPNTGANLWPQRPPRFKEQMLAWVEHMNALGRRLARLLAQSLNLPEDYFAAALLDPLTYSQLFHYPPQAAGTNAQIGAGAHVDWGFITILAQDEVGGLEVHDERGDWSAVPPIAGTFVIILGEMILRITNGRYRSAPHRVAINNEWPQPVLGGDVLRPQLRLPCRLRTDVPPYCGRTAIRARECRRPYARDGAGAAKRELAIEVCVDASLRYFVRLRQYRLVNAARCPTRRIRLIEFVVCDAAARPDALNTTLAEGACDDCTLAD
jgi:isopenicillin N synthase-like dioxygenase